MIGTIRTTLVCGLGLAAIVAGITGAGHLVDALPAAVCALAMSGDENVYEAAVTWSIVDRDREEQAFPGGEAS